MAPEPIQGRLGPGGGGEEEDLSPPSGLTLGPPLSSSDEELDHDSENLTVEYLPLSQDPEDETETDQNSLSSLMLALATHGPNIVPEEGGEEDGGQEERGREGVEIEVSSQTTDLMQESAQTRETEVRRERVALWTSRPTQPDALELDGGRVEEIKSAMASVTLPPSSIPAWARNLSDEDWESQIANLLSKSTYK